MNEVKLRGKAVQVKKFDWGCRFAINYFAGKDKEGKALYGFIDCKSFKVFPNEKEIIEASGWLSWEEVKYNEKNLSRIIYMVNEITPYQPKKEADVENYVDDLTF